MKARAPIQDSIDIRNYRNELKNSIVKRSRVNYIVDEKEILVDETTDPTKMQGVEENELEFSNVDPEVLSEAEEIYMRLQREAEADKNAKETEWIEKLTRENSTEIDESMYNATTGSYSGAYGKGDISDATKEQAANILGKKDEDFLAMLLEQAEKM